MILDEIFPDGEWVSNSEYRIRCPICGDHPDHTHCYINIDKKFFFCHYSGCKGHINKILKYENVELEPSQEITQEDIEKIDFSRFPKVTGKEGSSDRLAFTYLKSRGLEREDIEKYDIHYASSGRFFGRVLIPVYENKKIVCFVGRSYLKFVKPKYLFPRKRETILTANESLFGYDKIIEASEKEKNLEVWLVEGIFDAIAIDKKLNALGIALLSKNASKGQLNKIRQLPENIKLGAMFDADAHKDTLKTVEILKKEYDREILCVQLKRGDPASATSDELAEAVESSEIYSDELKIKTEFEDDNYCFDL